MRLHDAHVLAVIGDVDRSSVDRFARAMDELIDRLRPCTVLDLSSLTFMDAAGLGAIATAVRRLAVTDRRLTLRSAPRLTRRMLELAELNLHLSFQVDRLRVDEAAAGSLRHV
ncbi:hypothetical protein B7486_76750 [cyanobacterium TDX16]|nr:hypothetical protein B7486_76750 [cyanobacterium TDX16]